MIVENDIECDWTVCVVEANGIILVDTATIVFCGNFSFVDALVDTDKSQGLLLLISVFFNRYLVLVVFIVELLVRHPT